ncbi:glycoside hydrolase family 18 protein [Myriangium duriaei CBS 260.36]|uniref:chitinase n=1 Tax=Myriangium duriaei CBS 260.36 TaxID=1168546 RepID=A0A9P4J0C1_9PEZI|nr:glycoside hydrolase family 18 protein [Myriangium duriaei CBS 260.36]
MARFTLALAALLSFVSTTIAAFNAASDTNVAVYWGQGAYQARLVETCKNPSVDIVIIGFVNVFPDQADSGGYPGTNFGNACQYATYTNKTGGATSLHSACTYIGPDITTCQKTYGKKVLLSLGGAWPPTYFIAGTVQAKSFANFMWGAFGPVTSTWTKAKNPRPFGTAVVDGFDFDIESATNPVPTYNGVAVDDYKTRGYVQMIQQLKNVLFPKDTSKKYYISGAPQCVIPDAHLGTAVKQAWFDFLFIQFYNTASCSARTGIQHINGKTTNDISFNTWANVEFFNKNIKLYIGLPAATNASGSASYYLTPKEAKTLITKFLPNAKFGGVMLWEATFAVHNVVCGNNYITWMKKILNAVASNKSITVTCSTKRMLQEQHLKRDDATIAAQAAISGSVSAGSDGIIGAENLTPNAASSTTTVASANTPTPSIETSTSASPPVVTVTPEQVTSPAPASSPAPSSVPASTDPAVLTSASSASIPNVVPLMQIPNSATTSSGSSASSETPAATPALSTSSNSVISAVNSTSAPVPVSSAPIVSSDSSSLSVNSTTAANVTVAPTVQGHFASSTDSASPNASTTATDPTVASLFSEPSTNPPNATVTPSLTTTVVTQSTTTETVFTTVVRTKIEDNTTKLITTAVPVSTTTIVIDVTVTVFETPTPVTSDITTTTVASCDSSDPACTSSKKTLTVVTTTTIIEHATVTVQPQPERKKKTTTLYVTEITTTVIDVIYNPDASLYNPHSTDSVSTRTQHITRTATVNSTVTVTPMTTTQKSTTTVFEFVTIMPVAVQVKQGGNKVVAGDKAKASLATDAVAASGSLAAAASSGVLSQTKSAAGRLSPKDGGSWTHMLIASLFLAPIITMTGQDNKNSGASGAATAVTSTLGNLVGGVSRTAGGVVGAAGRGLGDTVTGVTGNAGKPVGDALNSLGNGVQDGTTQLAHGVEGAGQGKKVW